MSIKYFLDKGQITIFGPLVQSNSFARLKIWTTKVFYAQKTGHKPGF